jgi:hypothetical protein
MQDVIPIEPLPARPPKTPPQDTARQRIIKSSGARPD